MIVTRTFINAALLLSFLVSGCAARRSHDVAGAGVDRTSAPAAVPTEYASIPAAPPTGPQRSDSIAISRLVVHEEEVPERSVGPESMPLPIVSEEQPPHLSLEDLEATALANNPTLVQAQAQVQGDRGAAYQAGLPFNPVIGYTSEQIGVNGTAGELQGGFVDQEFVTGGKLRLSRTKWAQRAQIAATNWEAQRQRVLNDVRSEFYRALAAQRVVEIHRRLVANGEDNLQTQREMLNLGQTTAAAVLQAEVELRRDRLKLKDAENDYQQTWRTLAAMTGVPQLRPATLQEPAAADQAPLDYDSALDRLLSGSLELTAARQKIRHDQLQLERERVEPIPNILMNARVGRNFEAGDTTAGVNVGLRMPLYDQNRGTIQQAQADLNRSHAEARRLELELQTRLAAEYRTYLSAWQSVEEYQATMLPKAEEAAKLLRQSYDDPKLPGNRRAPWVDVLAADRLRMNLEIEYVESLKTYRESDVALRGMLLAGGLTEPTSAIGGGHIDATPKPR